VSRDPGEPTLVLLARRAAHYLYDRRSRARLRRRPVFSFPGLHETLAVHLAAALPARLLARLSLARHLALAERLARTLARGAHGGSRTALALRRGWWRTRDRARRRRPTGAGAVGREPDRP
jgi:hypothetical protein